MNEIIKTAFLETNEGYSTDRVVADPNINSRFIAACKRHGLHDLPAVLNKKLVNLRKSGKLGKQKSKQTRFDDEEYRFAAEVAVRHLERKKNVSLDDILLTPELAQQFDDICEEIVPGYSSLEYRWSALKLRKSRRLKPEIISHAIPAKEVLLLNSELIDDESIPRAAGIYCFVSNQEPLYIGEARCLRTRLRKHRTHSDNRFLARWLWEHGHENLTIELHVLPENVNTKTRRALEAEMIRSRKPAFNVQGQLPVSE